MGRGSEMIVRITRTVTAIEYVSDDVNPPVYCGIWDEVTGLTNREIEEEIKSISVCMWFSKGEPNVIKDEIKIERNMTPSG